MKRKARIANDTDAIDVFEAVAEYFSLPTGRWTADEKAAGGRFIMKEAAMRML